LTCKGQTKTLLPDPLVRKWLLPVALLVFGCWLVSFSDLNLKIS